MAVSPDPRTLLLPDPEAIPSVLGDKFIPIFASFLGVTSLVIGKIALRRPISSGVHQYAITAVLGAAAGKFTQDRFNQYYSDRDAVFRHYMELHPEDFPMPERTKIGDVFKAWTPIR